MLEENNIEEFHVKKGFRDFTDQTEIDYWESVYDRQDFNGICYRERINQALSWVDGLNLSRNSRILDVGCGPGILTREVAKRGYNVSGVDYSYGMIEKANSICNYEKKLNSKFLLGDIEWLPFKDSSFDVIICMGVITYLKSENIALSELLRILKPGATLIISFLNKACLAKHLDLPLFVKNRLQRILGNRIAFWKKRTEIKKGFTVKSYFIPHFVNSLKQQGFIELEYTTVPFGLLTFFGQEIFPKDINMKITMLLEKFSNIPLIGSFGGMCLFKVKKSPVANIASKI